MPQNTPASNTNKWYVAADGYDISGLITEINPDGSVDTEDVTAGSGTEHVQRKPKLRDTAAKFSAAYIDGQVPQYIYRIQPGAIINLVYGPEGNASGKPKHQQMFIVKKAEGPKQAVDKPMMLFKMDLEAADAPMVDMYKGGVFA
jgi:hypothetical protein